MSALAIDGADEAADIAVAAVIAAGREAARHGWIPATAGNFSVRVDAGRAAITRSGGDKGNLSPADILIQPLDAPLLPGSSAEALLHAARYRSHPETGAVFHVHGINASVIGQAHRGRDAIFIEGWELQKALAGVRSHETRIEVPLFANDQDIPALSARVEARFAEAPPEGAVRAPGYLIAGHGLYAFGATPAEAARHLEALETLFAQIIALGRYQP